MERLEESEKLYPSTSIRKQLETLEGLVRSNLLTLQWGDICCKYDGNPYGSLFITNYKGTRFIISFYIEHIEGDNNSTEQTGTSLEEGRLIVTVKKEDEKVAKEDGNTKVPPNTSKSENFDYKLTFQLKERGGGDSLEKSKTSKLIKKRPDPQYEVIIYVLPAGDDNDDNNESYTRTRRFFVETLLGVRRVFTEGFLQILSRILELTVNSQTNNIE